MSTASTRVAISGGKGNSLGTQLGIKVAAQLKGKGVKKPLMLEARLRMAAENPATCNVDSIYHDDSLQWNDNSMLGLHAASGMRISSGCPVRLLYGIQGGCEACKCVVPSLHDMKKVPRP